MKRVLEKSLDELYDEETRLLEELDRGEEKDGIYHELVRVYEQIYHKLNRLPETERRERMKEMDYVRQRIVKYLITYGTYMKMHLQKEDRVAKDSFKKVLKYDPTNPIAHYRLGFLAYKERKYATALYYFENALQFQDMDPDQRFALNDQQKYFAHLYLANSALFIAENTYKSLEHLPDRINKEPIPYANLSPFHELLQRNETILRNQAFIKVTPKGQTYCSKEECEEIMIHPPKNTVVLYFSDQENVVAFNGKEQRLSKDNAEMLCYFLLKTNPNQPARKKDLEIFFAKKGENGEVRDNTFIQRVKRLRDQLYKIWLPFPIIEPYRGEKAYFYNRRLDYIIMYRSDYTFLFDDNGQ